MTETAKLYDRLGREIVIGDIVKVFHFTGARRKRYYMYKQVMGIFTNGYAETYMTFSHLNFTNDVYNEVADGRILDDYEIVQSLDARFEERTRFRPLIQSSG